MTMPEQMEANLLAHAVVRDLADKSLDEQLREAMKRCGGHLNPAVVRSAIEKEAADRAERLRLGVPWGWPTGMTPIEAHVKDGEVLELHEDTRFSKLTFEGTGRVKTNEWRVWVDPDPNAPPDDDEDVECGCGGVCTETPDDDST